MFTFDPPVTGINFIEFLNFLDTEFSEEGTPVFILCGSQNFFHILQDIKPEIYHLWRRKFLKIPIGCFGHEASVDKLLFPNFKEQKGFDDSFFSEEVIKGISNFVYEVSSGYPSVMQILGKEISFLLEYNKSRGLQITMDALYGIVVDRVFWECIVMDTQSLCRELLSEEALGSKHTAYIKLIYQLYNNQSNNIDKLNTDYSPYELDTMLKDIGELQYIRLNGNRYTINYSFLKYNLWHPRMDSSIKKEVNAIWKTAMKITS